MTMTRTPPGSLTPLHGIRFGLGHKGELIANSKELTRPCVDASITLAAPAGNDRAIAIQLKDVDGQDINYAEMVEAFVLADAEGAAFATTGGSTGIVIGADGAMLTDVAKKRFTLISETDGDIDLTWTDTASEVCFLALRLPNGHIIVSAALTI